MRNSSLMLLNVVALLCSICSATDALAQGQGHSRSLDALKRAGTSAAAPRTGHVLSRPNDAATQAGDRLGQANGGLDRTNKAVTRAPDSQTPSTGTDTSKNNPQRILDHRLDQADHLRQLADKNGNDHLRDTATRMEANATKNNAKQTSATPSNQNSTPATSGSTPTSTTAAPTSTTPAPTIRMGSARRGFWLQSR